MVARLALHVPKGGKKGKKKESFTVSL